MHVSTEPIVCSDLGPGYGAERIARADADHDAVYWVLSADPDDEDGRSQWQWFRLPNGDLILGTFPQGTTYFDVVDRTGV